jgi:hypothetical protein
LYHNKKVNAERVFMAQHGLPGWEGPDEVERAARPQGKWHEPGDGNHQPEHDPEKDKRDAFEGMYACGAAILLRFLHPGADHLPVTDFSLSPYAIPALYGISVSRAGAALREAGRFRHTALYKLTAVMMAAEGSFELTQAAGEASTSSGIASGVLVGLGIGLGSYLKK